jgi:hypothetical protein
MRIFDLRPLIFDLDKGDEDAATRWELLQHGTKLCAKVRLAGAPIATREGACAPQEGKLHLAGGGSQVAKNRQLYRFISLCTA